MTSKSFWTLNLKSFSMYVLSRMTHHCVKSLCLLSPYPPTSSFGSHRFSPHLEYLLSQIQLLQFHSTFKMKFNCHLSHEIFPAPSRTPFNHSFDSLCHSYRFFCCNMFSSSLYRNAHWVFINSWSIFWAPTMFHMQC